MYPVSNTYLGANEIFRVDSMVPTSYFLSSDLGLVGIKVRLTRLNNVSEGGPKILPRRSAQALQVWYVEGSSVPNGGGYYPAVGSFGGLYPLHEQEVGPAFQVWWAR